MLNNCGLKIGGNFITCVYTVNVGMCEAVYFKINTHVFFTYYELRLAKKTVKTSLVQEWEVHFCQNK